MHICENAPKSYWIELITKYMLTELWNSVSATSGNITRTDIFVSACWMSVVVPEFQVDFAKDAFVAAA